MWFPSPSAKVSSVGGNVVAVAIDKDKGSQQALKWATENLVTRGQTIILIHVVSKSSSSSSTGHNHGVNGLVGGGIGQKKALEKHTKELLLAFHCFCMRKNIQCFDVVLEDSDVARALVECVSHAAIESLVLGASHHGFIKRFKMIDIPTSVSKGIPDFCTLYVISKSKISSVKNASRRVPFVSPLLAQIQQMQGSPNGNGLPSEPPPKQMTAIGVAERMQPKSSVDATNLIKSPFSRGRGYAGNMFGDPPNHDSDVSFTSSGRPSADGVSTDCSSGLLFDGMGSSRTSRLSTSSESSYGSMQSSARGSDFSSCTTDSSSTSLENDDVEAEMRRLKLELQKTMEMYSTACKEAMTAKQKAEELHRWRMEEERRLEEARLSEEAARLAGEQDRAKNRAALQNAQASQRLSEIDSQKRVSAEMKGYAESNNEPPLSLSSLRYRRYTIDEIEEATNHFDESLKIGEGGYGPVFKCYLDHTRVAVKVLRPDAAQGREQFQREVEVLSCLRHPNMVLLLGACPEYGCLVYENMAMGSLEDRLRRRGNTPSLSWQLRFRIAAEIATGLHFLHQTKPEPLVHRDLKPANILLDHNYVSKISDVGLARLVPASVAEGVTQYRMTSAAGTFCYIDPEYQQTGMLGVKSDVYSFGIVLLQLVTGKPAMGLSHNVARAIDKDQFTELLDPTVPDWPVEKAFSFAKLALQCAELRRKDRPDLGKIVLPELQKWGDFAEENMGQLLVPN